MGEAGPPRGAAGVRAVGLDLGGTNIKGVVVEDVPGGAPVVVASASVPTDAARGPDAVGERMVGLGRDLVAAHGPVDGAGIGVPGLFDRDVGTITLFPNLPGPWPGHPLRDQVAKGLGLPVAVINDARAFTLASRTVGASHSRIISRHVLPNALAPVIVAATFGMANAILLEAGLSFLGLGVQPPTPSWGNMLTDAQSISVLESMPWLWIPPGIMIALAVLSINFIGDGLRDALDPHLLH